MEGSILFSVVGRTHYGFDIFSVQLPADFEDFPAPAETLRTDGLSVNFNGSFDSVGGEDGCLIYVSERSGAPGLYINGGRGSKTKPRLGPIHSTVGDEAGISELFFDRPTLKENKVYFVSTQKKPPADAKEYYCWTAVYCTTLELSMEKLDPKQELLINTNTNKNNTVRLSPPNVADFSPSLSPSGKWLAVASYQGRGWQGDIQDLHTDIYIFKSVDGTQRKRVAKNGGWPTWADEETLFFHRKSEDGWWSVYKVSHVCTDKIDVDEDVVEERITPPCVHAFTPAASTSGDWIAVATRRPESKFRQIEIFDLKSKEFVEVTARLNPEKHHYNPFVAAGSTRMLGYHRCRDLGHDVHGGDHDNANTDMSGTISPNLVARMEGIECPVPGLTLARIDGFFPSVSPCGRFVAYNRPVGGVSGFGGVSIMRSDGSKAWRISNEDLFTTTWDPLREGTIYCSSGAIFAPPSQGVQVAALHFSLDSLTDDVDQIPSTFQLLTHPGTGNNAFPSVSPDGKRIVFRSGRGGGNSKNLYIMDAEKGDGGAEVFRLTSGEWTDTMPCWSPDGKWIAFSSTRDSMDEGSFGLYMIRPDGSGLHRIAFRRHDDHEEEDGLLLHARDRVNHVHFSPDSQHIVFTSSFAGVSAEPISLPNQFQPYGELFVSRSDGSELVRLTHNAYEDGTPTWTWKKIELPHHRASTSEGLPYVASSGGEALRGDFAEPMWLSRITEQMKGACV